jgi:phage gpG-like protein
MIAGTVTGDDLVVARLAGLPDKMRERLTDAMKRQWFKVQAAVVTGKLSGDPLHRRTGVLASSINVGGSDTATTFDDQPAQIIARIGTKVRYGKVHEDGGTFQIPAHERRLTQVFGRAIEERTVSVRAHTATFPQRSFLRSTLRDLGDQIKDDIRQAIAQAVAGR